VSSSGRSRPRRSGTKSEGWRAAWEGQQGLSLTHEPRFGGRILIGGEDDSDEIVEPEARDSDDRRKSRILAGKSGSAVAACEQRYPYRWAGTFDNHARGLPDDRVGAAKSTHLAGLGVMAATAPVSIGRQLIGGLDRGGESSPLLDDSRWRGWVNKKRSENRCDPISPIRRPLRPPRDVLKHRSLIVANCFASVELLRSHFRSGGFPHALH